MRSKSDRRFSDNPLIRNGLRLFAQLTLVRWIWESPAKYAAQIQEELTPFQDALDEIGSQKREVEKAQKAKLDLLAELGERLTWSIRLFEAIYRLAGLGFHADRLRVTSVSRPSSGEPAGETDTGGETETEEVEASPSAEAPESSSTAP